MICKPYGLDDMHIASDATICTLRVIAVLWTMVAPLRRAYDDEDKYNKIPTIKKGWENAMDKWVLSIWMMRTGMREGTYKRMR